MGRYDPKTPSSFNIVSLTMTLALAGTVYAGLTFGPHYYPLFEIRGLLSETANSGYRQHKDRVLYDNLMKKAQAANLDVELRDFRIERSRYEQGELAELSHEQRKVARRRGKSITVSFEKYVDVKWLFIDKWTEIKLNSSRTVELSQVTW